MFDFTYYIPAVTILIGLKLLIAEFTIWKH